MMEMKKYQFWFCTGSQDLYGDECLAHVAEHSKIIVEELNKSGNLPFEVVWKPTLLTNELIRKTFNEANTDELCAGVITWMHTFSPAKSWILGLQELRKPLLHLHTQFNREIPYDTIDMAIDKPKVDLRKEVYLIAKNKPLLMLMLAFGTDMIANSTLLAVNMYYFKYVLNRVDLVPITSIALTVTGVLSNLAIPYLTKKAGKKRLYWWGSLLSILPLAILQIKPVVPGSALLVLITLFGLISTVPSALAWAMLPDCVDYAEYITGVNGNGVVSSTFSFMNKLCGAVGSFLASYLLGIFGFVANQEQTETVLFVIVCLRFAVPILGYIASLISMHFYELTDKRNLEIRRALEERAGGKENGYA